MHLLKYPAALFIATALVGCTAKTETAPPTLEGTWVYESPGGTSGVGLTFESGRYVAQQLVLTSPSTGQVMLELGTYTTTGNEIALAPEQTTCVEDTGDVVKMRYSFQGTDALTIVLPSGILSMDKVGSEKNSNFALELGCRRDGVFSPSPLAPIKR